MEDQKFEQWACIELMGHRSVYGLIHEHQIAGKGFVRVDVFGKSEFPINTSFYSPDSVYAVHPVEERICRLMTERSHFQPITPYEVRMAERALNPPEETADDGGNWDRSSDDDDQSF